MTLLSGSVGATHILDNNELASDATRLGDERGASVRRQVMKEVAGEDPVELVVAERQRCGIALDTRACGRGAAAISTIRPLWSSAITSPRRC